MHHSVLNRAALIGAICFVCFACGASLPPELQPPDEPGARVEFWIGNAERSCRVAEALGVALPPAAAAVCALLLGQQPAASAPSGDGPEPGAATPASIGGAPNGVRNVGGGGG